MNNEIEIRHICTIGDEVEIQLIFPDAKSVSIKIPFKTYQRIRLGIYKFDRII